MSRSFLHADLNSDSDPDDDDFVDDLGDEEEYDSEGRRIKKSSKRKTATSTAANSRSRAACSKRMKNVKVSGRVGAAVVSDEEEDDGVPATDSAQHPHGSSTSASASPISTSSSLSSKDFAATSVFQSSRPVNNSKIDALWASLRSDEEPKPKPSSVSTTSLPNIPTNTHQISSQSSAPSIAIPQPALPISSTVTSISSASSSAPIPVATSTPSSPSALSINAATATVRAKPKIDFSRRTKSLQDCENEKKVTVEKEVEFAGEKVSVAATVEKDSEEAKKALLQKASGLDKILSQFEIAKQMTTFDKSKVDWERDKALVGDHHELAQARMGKDGVLDKMSFLSRVDQAQFERERAERLRAQVSAARSPSTSSTL